MPVGTPKAAVLTSYSSAAPLTASRAASNASSRRRRAPGRGTLMHESSAQSASPCRSWRRASWAWGDGVLHQLQRCDAKDQRLRAVDFAVMSWQAAVPMLHPGLRDAASKGCASLQIILCEAMLRSHAEFGTAQSADNRHDYCRIRAAVGPLSFVASQHLSTPALTICFSHSRVNRK